MSQEKWENTNHNNSFVGIVNSECDAIANLSQDPMDGLKGAWRKSTWDVLKDTIIIAKLDQKTIMYAISYRPELKEAGFYLGDEEKPLKNICNTDMNW